MKQRMNTTYIAALFALPAIWVAQMTASNIFTTNVCYPGQAPLQTPQWDALTPMLMAVNVACILCALVSIAYISKLWNRHRIDGKSDTAEVGRSNFLLLAGLLTNLVFAVAIAFTSCAVIFVSPCALWR
jgi:hypothetical protein